MLAPGGTRIDDGDKTKVTEYCVFGATEDQETIRDYAQVFNKLNRRYKYLEKAFEDAVKKLLLFLKAFSTSEQTKLAILTGILLANGSLPATILTSLFSDSLVKEGISASFAVKVFKAWMAEKDANAVTSSLRKVNLDKRLLELFPANKQNFEHFATYFTNAGLKELSDFLRIQQNLGTRKELQKELQEKFSQEYPVREKIVVLFYKADVLSEEAILKWYKEAHVAKGKSIFLEQMKKFVEWLQNAEEGNLKLLHH
uniref:eIF5-mimic protein 1 n=1 Tax=Callorhinchus milii TaxID=7868 RepID=A0A4W3HGL5_CALMI